MFERFRGSSIKAIERDFRWHIPQHFNIGVWVCDRHPGAHVAMLHEHVNGVTEVLTYGELTVQSNRLANALDGLGVKHADRVAVSLPQCPALAVTHIAAYKMGAVAVPMTTLFGSDALLFRIRDSGAKVLITDAATRVKIEDYRGDMPALQCIVVLDDDWPALLGKAAPQYRAVNTRADDPAFLVYTSGTTGTPKGALHSHKSLLGHLPGFELSHDFYGQPGDKFWTPADWSWIGGLYDALFPVLYHGSTIVSFARTGAFDPEYDVHRMARYEIHNAFLPPTALKLIRQADANSPTNLRLRSISSGGEPLGEEILQWIRERFSVAINEFYGQTECNYVTGNCQVLYPIRPGSMGRPYPGHTVAVIDGDGCETAEMGQIAVRRPDPVMFSGYWNNPDASEHKFNGDWLLTGDLGIRDADGYFWFQGRADDVINSAGYRIGPTEIENCLLAHPSVALAAVIGIPDELRGEVIKAYIVPRAGALPGPELAGEIRKHVRSRLAEYLYPREIEFMENLPLTTTGKVRRKDLREQHERTRTHRKD